LALPPPRPGLVIGYSYLWLREYALGQETGRKDRPCVIILAVENKDGQTVVIAAPITHTAPASESAGFAIPVATKTRLGLDSAPSWVILDEVNRFSWPGPDLRPVSRAQPDQFAYGMLPPALFARIKHGVLENIKSQRSKIVPRTD